MISATSDIDLPPSASLRRACSVGAVAALLALAWLLFQPHLAPWGDGLRFIKMFTASPGEQISLNHFGYSVAVWLGFKLTHSLGIDFERGLEWVSIAPAALAFGVSAAAAVRTGARQGAAIGWALVAAAAPSTVLLTTIVEVHGIQLLAASIGIWMLVESRSVTPRWRVAITGLAMVVVVAGHTSQVLLLLPFALHSALCGRRRTAFVVGGVSVVAVAALFAIAIGMYLSHERSEAAGLFLPLYVLGQYAHAISETRLEYGWFGPREVVEFLWAEWLAMSGLLYIAVFGMAGSRRKPTDWAFVAALVGYLAVLAATGLRERGAYFLALFPWLVVLGARLHTALPWILLVAQAPLGYLMAREDAQREDARHWTVGMERVVEIPFTIYTADMARKSAINGIESIVVAQMWYFEFQLVPRRSWGLLGDKLDAELTANLTAGHVYIDADVLPDPDGRGEPWQLWTRRFLDERGFELRPIARPALDVTSAGPASDAPYLFELSR